MVLNFFAGGTKSRRSTLLERLTKEILTQVNWHVLFYSRTRSVTQNIRDFIERLLRTAQRVLGGRMRLTNQWLRTTSFKCNFLPRLKIVTLQTRGWLDINHLQTTELKCTQCTFEKWKFILIWSVVDAITVLPVWISDMQWLLVLLRIVICMVFKENVR